MSAKYAQCRNCEISGDIVFLSSDGFCQMSCRDQYRKETESEGFTMTDDSYNPRSWVNRYRYLVALAAAILYWIIGFGWDLRVGYDLVPGWFEMGGGVLFVVGWVAFFSQHDRDVEWEENWIKVIGEE